MRGLVSLAAALGAIQGGTPARDDLQAARAAFTVCTDAFGLAAVALADFAAHGHGAPAAAVAAGRYPFLLTTGAMFSPRPTRAQRAKLLAALGAAHPQGRAGLAAPAAALGYPDVPSPAETPGFGVRVEVLERVQVVRTQEGRAREWGRAKARDLLTLLAVHRAGLPRETAQEALFPGAEPGVGERNFRVTLHALGQVLEDGAASGVFLERGEWLRLRPGPDLHVDLWAAWTVLETPPGTPGRLRALLELGARVAVSVLRDVQGEADRYAAALPDALATVAGVVLDAGDPDAAVLAAERALGLDPAHEPAARTAMRAHHARGNPAAARRVYAALCAALRELELRPLPDTNALRHALGGRDALGSPDG
jgi:DNA-binding SARP family transcriptional activator